MEPALTRDHRRAEAGRRGSCGPPERAWTLEETRRLHMLWTITVLLFLMWLIGMVTNYTLGGFIHLLLLLAIVSVLIRVIQGQRPV
jgi:Family of unknown function (DUF5670)